MNDYVYNLLKEAKQTNNISLLHMLYENYPQNKVVACEYAKALIKTGNIELAKKILTELSGTKYKKYVIDELNKTNNYKKRKKTIKK